MVLSSWNRNSFKNFLGLFETSLAPRETHQPFLVLKPTAFPRRHFTLQWTCVSAFISLAILLFLISAFPVLLRAHQVTGWKRLGTVFTDACWLVSFSATFHTFPPANSLSWMYSTLSWFQSSIFPSDTLPLFTWSTLLFSYSKCPLLRGTCLSSSPSYQCLQVACKLLACCH